MPPTFIKPRPLLTVVFAAAAIMLTASAQADQTLGSAPSPEKDPGFFQRASNDVGNFFKRLFKTDDRNSPRQPAPPPNKGRSRGPRYNLDQPPAELRRTPADSGRFNSPTPASSASKDGAGGNAKSKSPANSLSRDSEIVDEPPKSKTRVRKSAPSNSDPAVTSTDATARPKPKMQTETGPGAAAGTDNVVSSGTGTANAKQPEPSAKVETENIPTPPKAPVETSSPLTGTKTGKSGRVKSPYAPYSELDVTGLPSGSLALDPTTQKVFRIP